MKRTLPLLLIVLSININAKDIDTTSVLLEGTIYDTNDTPIIGAIVNIENHPDIGVITDLDGNYKLEVKSSDIKTEKVKVVVQYIGCSNQKIQIKTKNEAPLKIDFIMEKRENKVSTLRQLVIPSKKAEDPNERRPFDPKRDKLKDGTKEPANPIYIECEQLK